MENVVRGPWPQSDAQERNSSFERDKNEKRYAKAHQVWSELKDQARLPLADRKQMARNLGDLISELALDLGIAPKVALRQVWDQCGLEHSWAKRLRYVRFEEDAEKKTDEYASSAREFANLAKVALKLKPHNIVSGEDMEAEAILRLLARTSYDPDPFKNAKIDFDAARAVAELGEAFIQQVESAVPGLKTYFERLAKFQLFHRPWPEQVYRERFQASLAQFEQSYFNHWCGDKLWLIPVDVDTSKFFGEFESAPSSAHNMDQEADFLGHPIPNRFLFDGFPIADELGHTAVPGLLPRVHIGDIHGFQFGRGTDNATFAPQSDDEFYPRPQVLESHPQRVHLVLAPTKVGSTLSIRIGLVVEAWPFSNLRFADDGAGYLGHEQPDVSVSEPTPGDALNPIPVTSVVNHLPWASIDRLMFLPGSEAQNVIGVQGVNNPEESIHEIRSTAMRDGQDWSTLIETKVTSVIPAIAIGQGFTPYPANTLAAALFSNLLYVKGEGSVLIKMIADAKSRVETLEGQFQEWMTEFHAAKHDFIKGSGNDA